MRLFPRIWQSSDSSANLYLFLFGALKVASEHSNRGKSGELQCGWDVRSACIRYINITHYCTLYSYNSETNFRSARFAMSRKYGSAEPTSPIPFRVVENVSNSAIVRERGICFKRRAFPKNGYIVVLQDWALLRALVKTCFLCAPSPVGATWLAWRCQARIHPSKANYYILFADVEISMQENWIIKRLEPSLEKKAHILSRWFALDSSSSCPVRCPTPCKWPAALRAQSGQQDIFPYHTYPQAHFLHRSKSFYFGGRVSLLI